MLFDLYDFESKGSLDYEEMFLLIDCSSAGACIYGGYKKIPESSLESVLHVVFQGAPLSSVQAQRLSRYGLVKNNSVQLSRWFMDISDTLNKLSITNKIRTRSLLFKSNTGWFQLKEEAISHLYNEITLESKKYSAGGDCKIVSGCSNAYYIGQAGILIQIAGAAVVVHPNDMGSTAHESIVPPTIYWRHVSPIKVSYFSSRSNIVATACSSRLLVWFIQDSSASVLASLAIVDGCTSISLCDKYLCCAFTCGTAVVYSIENKPASNKPGYTWELLQMKLIRVASHSPKVLLKHSELVVYSHDGVLQFIDLKTGRTQNGFVGCNNVGGYLSAAYHPISNYLVLGGTEGKLHVFQGIKLVSCVSAHEGQLVASLHASSRGFCTVGDTDGVIKLWSMNVNLVATLTGYSELEVIDRGVKRICWSMDGKKLLVVSNGEELFQLCGISGNLLVRGTSSHVLISSSYSIHGPSNMVVTTGFDKTLKLWSSGVLVSTCMLDSYGICVTGNVPEFVSRHFSLLKMSFQDRVITDSSKLVCAVGMVGGVSVIERDEMTKQWVEKFKYSESGFDPKCIALSPCNRFVAAGTKIFDIVTNEFHGDCPALSRFPNNFYFSSKVKGYWKFHVNEQVFDLSIKTMFHGKSLQLVTEVPWTDKDQLVVVDSEGEIATEDNEAVSNPKLRVWSGDASGSMYLIQNKKLFLSSTPVNCTSSVIEMESFASSKISKVQGCSVITGDSVASCGCGILAYTASDLIVVRCMKTSENVYLQLYGRILCVYMSTIDKCRVRLVATDGLVVAIWDVDVEMFEIRELHKVPFGKANIMSLKLSIDAKYVIASMSDGQAHVLDCRTGFVFSSFLLQLYSDEDRKAFPLKSIDQLRKLQANKFKSRLGFLKNSADEIQVVEIRVGSTDWVLHTIQGCNASISRQSHEFNITCIDDNWIGDARGSIWKVNIQEAELTLLVSSAHDKGPVLGLCSRISASREGILRKWNDDASLKIEVDMRQYLGQANCVLSSLSRDAIITDDHRLIDTRSNSIEEMSIITATHSKVKAVTFAFVNPASISSNTFVTIGDLDTSICLWSEGPVLISKCDLASVAPVNSTSTCCQLSFAGHFLAVGTCKGTVHILRVPELCPVATLDCGGGTNYIQCIGWSPDASQEPSSENCRLAVARKDKTLYFFDHKFNLIGKPLTNLTGLQALPNRISFADDCEIVMCEDIKGAQVYADSVSSNLIPEDHMVKRWITPPTTDSVCIDDTVIKQLTGTLSSKISQKQKPDNVKAIWDVLENPIAFGASQKCKRFINSDGELCYIAGNTVLGFNMNTKSQRAIHQHPHSLIQMVAFDESSTFRDLYCLFSEYFISVVDTITNRLVKQQGILKPKNPLYTENSDKKEYLDLKSVAVDFRNRDCVDPHVTVLMLWGSNDINQLLIVMDLTHELQYVLHLSQSYDDCCFIDHTLFCLLDEDKCSLANVINGSFEHVLDIEGIACPTACVNPGIVGDASGKIHILSKSNLVKTLQAHPLAVSAISVSGNYETSGSFTSMDVSGNIKVWANWKQCIAVKQLGEPSTFLSLHPNSMSLVTDNHEILCEACHEEPTWTLPFQGNQADCTCSTFLHEDSKIFLFTAAKDLSLCKWDVSSAALVDNVQITDTVIFMAFCKSYLFMIVDAVPKRLLVLDSMYYDVVHQLKLPSDTITRLEAVDEHMLLIDDQNKLEYICELDSFKVNAPRSNVNSPIPSRTVSLRGNCAFLIKDESMPF